MTHTCVGSRFFSSTCVLSASYRFLKRKYVFIKNGESGGRPCETGNLFSCPWRLFFHGTSQLLIESLSQVSENRKIQTTLHCFEMTFCVLRSPEPWKEQMHMSALGMPRRQLSCFVWFDTWGVRPPVMKAKACLKSAVIFATSRSDMFTSHVKLVSARHVP